MKSILMLLFLVFTLSAKNLTVNDVYAKTEIIEQHLHFLLKYYNVKHNHLEKKHIIISSKLKPRNSWQKAYELLVKINRLRLSHELLRIEPIGMEPVENLTIGMLYGMVDRVLTEIIIFEHRKGLIPPTFKLHKGTNKNLLDIYNILSLLSLAFDELNGSTISSAYIYAETMRIYDDLTIILNHLHISDNTIPNRRLKDATIKDATNSSFKLLTNIIRLHRIVGISSIQCTEFNKVTPEARDLYNIVGLIVAELQPLKAHLGLTKNITPSALSYENKTPADIEQLMSWNFRKLELIKSLERR